MTIGYMTKNKDKRLRGYISKILYYINNTNIPKKYFGVWVRAIHYSLPVFILFLFFFTNKSCVIFGMILYSIALISFIYFKGKCWISALENELLTDNINLVDLHLLLMG